MGTASEHAVHKMEESICKGRKVFIEDGEFIGVHWRWGGGGRLKEEENEKGNYGEK
jgi:hypothetical protein